ncbi:hypothetical protein [Caulobacter vibrioides]|nr:hypothetical protein [Caulobacter vibrioides]YP_002516837.2 hypothetical protein CCNA_01464 [Caulobacter vibrioides NA1000]ACL94929.2 hypothetical protein CCNA_01464 [Caulobacter vibrioides NA1000]QXZ53474.1 hypothetical protein KZH45_07345 [Caulobacter vibrioides]
MMRIATGLVLAALLATPALAQNAAPPPAAASASAFSADTPLEAVVANPAAKAALDKTLPALAKHPAFEQFKGMSLRELQAYAEGQITNEMIAKVDADLKALSTKP